MELYRAIQTNMAFVLQYTAYALVHGSTSRFMSGEGTTPSIWTLRRLAIDHSWIFPQLARSSKQKVGRAGTIRFRIATPLPLFIVY